MAALAVVYFASAKLGLTFAMVAEQVSLVWPPSGIALGVLMLCGVRLWPGVLLGAFLAHWTAAESPLVALAIAAGDTLGAVLGVYLLQKAGLRGRILNLSHALSLIGFGAVVSATIGATVGSASLVIGGLQPLSALSVLWRDDWLGNSVGILTVAPVVLNWAPGAQRPPESRSSMEAAALGVGMVVASWGAFLQPESSSTQSYPLHYLVFPFVAWGALRFGSRGSSLVVLGTSAIAALSIALGLGRFGSGSREGALLWLELYVAVVAVTGLLLGAVVDERDAAHHAVALAAEKERLRAHQLAEQDKRKDEFLARLAHELRNPLAPIAGATRLLRHEKGDPLAVDRLRQVLERQIVHLLRLVEDLLDVARITAGKVKLQIRRVELQQVLRSAVEMSAAQLETHKVELVWDVPATTIWIDADAVRLAQIVQNLLSNAARHGGSGGHVWLSARVEGDRVVLAVRDDGAGMSAEVLARAFEPFAQGPGSGKNLGLGIGLTLVRELSQLHDGKVEAESEGPGKGSVFRVILPLQASASTSSTAPVRGELAAQEHSAKRQVLVVDDNADAAEMLAGLVAQRGHRVSVVHDGEGALERARSVAPDVMLLDIEMPRMSGYEVARAVRKDPELRRVRLIAISGHLGARDGRLDREAGFDVHLVKPVDPEALYAALE